MQCADCPDLAGEGPKRVRCCGETIDQAAERIAALGQDAPVLGGWAPGDYNNSCVGCGALFTGDKRAIACLPCAIMTAENPRTTPLTPAEQAQIDAILARLKPEPNSDQAAAPAQRQTLDNAAGRPKIGQKVKIGGQFGVVCAPDDPQRSGTYESAKYGSIPVRMFGNRHQRRAARHKAKKGRGR